MSGKRGWRKYEKGPGETPSELDDRFYRDLVVSQQNDVSIKVENIRAFNNECHEEETIVGHPS